MDLRFFSKLMLLISLSMSETESAETRLALKSKNATSSADGYNVAIKFLRCNSAATNLSACIKAVSEDARDILARGVPALNVPAMDPLRIPNVRLRHHSATRPNQLMYDAWISDIMLKGLSLFKVYNVEVNREALTVTANLSLPQLYMESDYILLGHFQMLPVEATGKFGANFTSCTARIRAESARLHSRLVVRDVVARLSCARPVASDLTQATGGDGDHMDMITDHIIKMHSDEILTEVKPAVETTLAMLLEDVANKFLKGVDYDNLTVKTL